jgi:outer membrane lipopolysaccharide assembly protein LptE/RlpB
MLSKQPAKADQGGSTRTAMPILLILTVLCLSGCGFVLAPIETVTLGTLSAVVKEVDRQRSIDVSNRRRSGPRRFRTQTSADHSIDENPAAEQLPKAEFEQQITRISLMP